MRLLRKIHAGVSAFATFALVASCGDVYADPDGPAVGPGPTAATATSIPEVPQTPCGKTRPRENTSCSVVGRTCEFGESADPQCNAVLACDVTTSGVAVWEARAGHGCISAKCTVGSDTASLEGKPCSIDGGVSDTDETVCNMTDGVCACTTGAGGADVHERRWVCVHPAATACPSSRPLAGQACPGTLYCDYGGCAFKRGVVMECKGGVWVMSGSECKR
jgi:hypothetical protein